MTTRPAPNSSPGDPDPQTTWGKRLPHGTFQASNAQTTPAPLNGSSCSLGQASLVLPAWKLSCFLAVSPSCPIGTADKLVPDCYHPQRAPPMQHFSEWLPTTPLPPPQDGAHLGLHLPMLPCPPPCTPAHREVLNLITAALHPQSSQRTLISSHLHGEGLQSPHYVWAP